MIAKQPNPINSTWSHIVYAISKNHKPYFITIVLIKYWTKELPFFRYLQLMVHCTHTLAHNGCFYWSVQAHTMPQCYAEPFIHFTAICKLKLVRSSMFLCVVRCGYSYHVKQSINCTVCIRWIGTCENCLLFVID